MRPAPHMSTTQSHESSGARLVTADGRTLPFRGATLAADARAGIARVVVTQRFVNPYDEALAVTYLMPLPADGAVSGYAFQIGERRITGEVDRRAAARERFEEALASGRSAALIEQERSSLFTQEIGNIPPHTEVTAEITVDQRLRWLDEGAWEWRFPTAAMPRYQGAAGRVPDADRVTVEVADAPLPARVTIELAIRDALPPGRRPESPSHALHVGANGKLGLAAEGGAQLDRDLVVRWPVAQPKVGLALDVARPADGRPHAGHAYGLLTVVPPQPEHAPRPVPRDLIVLLDTSGSMSGEPIEQAKHVVMALLGTLGDHDRLEMIEFSNRPSRWKKGAVQATAAALAEAREWLVGLEAGGGTEMKSGILEALTPLRADSQRQIVLVTDGAIGFETEVIGAICEKLPASSRLHTVGVGSAVNRSLTAPAARAGRGIEVVIGLGEDPERAAARLCARTAAPLVVELQVSGSALEEHAPGKLADLFAGAPALVGVKLRAEGGELRIRGRTADGVWEDRIRVPAAAPASGSQAVVALYGREAIEDVEMRIAAQGYAGELDRVIERIGLDFQIASRLTSWIAVSEEAAVDPREPLRRERVPQELPHGVSMEGLGLRPASGMVAQAKAQPLLHRVTTMAAAPSTPPASAAGPMPPQARRRRPGVAGFDRDLDAKDDLEMAAEYEAPALGGLWKREQELSNLAATPRLRGRIVLTKDRELVIEIVAYDEIDWAPPADAEARCEDGLTIPAHVDESRTTRAGRIPAGRVIRLALKLDSAPTSGVREIHLGELVIEV